MNTRIPVGDCLKIHSYIGRECTDLPRLQLRLLLFICQRTAGWQKTWERIPMSHFVNGVYSSKTGECYCKPIRTHPKRIRAALKALEEAGLIIIIHQGENEAPHYELNLDTMLKRSKKTAGEGGAKMSPRGGHFCTKGGGQNVPPNKVKEENTFKQLGNPAPEGDGIVENSTLEAIQKGVLMSEALTARLAERKRRRKVPPSEIAALWDGLAGLPLSSGEKHALANYSKRFNEAHDGSPPFEVFLEFVVEEWSRIGLTAMGWMTRYPAQPSPGVIVKYCSAFEEYARKELIGHDWQGASSELQKHRKARREGIREETKAEEQESLQQLQKMREEIADNKARARSWDRSREHRARGRRRILEDDF